MNRDLAKHYGLTLSPKILGAVRESLTSAKGDDLVDRHLRANYGYFGAIDKTLAGFVVLDDTGDDFTLLDVRDSGQVYFQDHDDRIVEVMFDSIDDYLGFKKAVAAAGDDADEDDLRAEWGTSRSRAKKKPTTPQLCARYQWLVWLLGQPMERGPANEDNEAKRAVDTAMDLFAELFPKDAGRALFAKERSLLAKDPYVALYWLLHTTMVGQHEARAVVLAAAKKSKHPLLAAFAHRFAALAPSSDLPVLSRFVARRSGATLLAGEDRALDALAIDANNDLAALLVVEMLEEGKLSPRAARAALGAASDTLPRAFVLAVADLRDGKTTSEHADVAMQLASKTGADWDTAAGAVIRVHELARDTTAVVEALEKLLERDTYHAGMLRVAQALRARTKKPLFEDERMFAKRLEIAEATASLLEALQEKKPAKILAGVDKQLAPFLARRLMQRLELGETYPPEAVSWAFTRVVSGSDDDRFRLAAHAMQHLDRFTITRVLPELAKQATNARHPVVDLLLRFVESTPEPRNNDDEESAFDDACDAIFHVLAKHARDAQVAERLVAVLEQGEARRITVRSFIGECLSPYNKKGYLLPKLSDAHALRVAKALVHINALPPVKATGHLRANAGHQLFRFKHRGAETFFIEALHDYTKRYADEAPAERYEDVVANLYEAVANLKSDRGRAALVEQIFRERREYWRLASALEDSFSVDLHRQILRELAKRKDTMATVKYTYALASHIEKSALLLDVAPLLVSAKAPTPARERAYFKCALLSAKHAALVAKRFDLVRALHACDAELKEKPLDLHIGASWKSPFDDKSVARALVESLAPSADVKADMVAADAKRSRARGKPNLRVTDKQLAAMAAVELGARLFHDLESGEVWFSDNERGFHYFDGYAVTKPPFRVASLHFKPMATFLEGTKPADERVMAWRDGDRMWIELVRFGARVVYRWGYQNSLEAPLLGLTFDDASAAKRALERFRVHPGKIMRVTDPWYLAGRGAIARTFSWGAQNRVEVATWDGPDTPTAARQAELGRAATKREHEILTKKNGLYREVEWLARCRRAEDLTLAEWLQAVRARAKDTTAVDVVKSLDLVVAQLAKQDVKVPGLAVAHGTRISARDIAAFEKVSAAPVPAPLRQLWTEIGTPSWKVGKVAMRVLSPREMLAAREAVRKNARYAKQDALVVDEAGRGWTFLVDQRAADDARFSMADGWTSTLGWCLDVDYGARFTTTLRDAQPLVDELWFDQKVHAGMKRVSLADKSGRFFRATLDSKVNVLATRTGKKGEVGKVAVRRLDAAELDKDVLAALVAAQKSRGFSAHR